MKHGALNGRWTAVSLCIALASGPAVAEPAPATNAGSAPAQGATTAPPALAAGAATPAASSAPAQPANAPPNAAAAAPADAPRFDVWEYRVEGNSVLDNPTVEKTVYGFLGPGKTIDDVEKARNALEKAYRDAGYAAAMVDIPEQDVNNGVVILKVGEGTIDRMRVTGSRYFALGHIKEKVPALAPGKPLHLPTVQDQLGKLAGESADRTITPVMRAGRTPGTVEVDLAVEDELPLHGSLELNNRNSIDTTRLRLTGMLRYDNLWQMNHSASLQYQVSPENADNVQVWSGTYVMPIEPIDSRLVFYGVGLDSQSDVASVGALSVVGNGTIFGARLIKPLPGNARYSHSATLGWDYKDFGQSVVLTGADTQNTPISYSPFMASYTGTLGYEGGSYTQFNTEVDFNFAGMGSNYQEFENRRYGATPGYLYFAGDIKHRQVLPADLIAQFRLAGQIADGPLISNEQMGVGGMLSARAYHEIERLGDNGVSGAFEFFSPNLGAYGLEYVDDLRLTAFSELAEVWLKDALPGTPTRYNLFDVGTGFRAQVMRRILGEFYWAYPFTATEAVKVGDSRIYFRAIYEF